MWVPKDRTQSVVELPNHESQNKRRRLVWREKEPKMHAYVNMIRISGGDEMHAFVNMVGDEDVISNKKNSKNKPDRASSSRNDHDEQKEEEPIRSDQEEGGDKSRWAEGENARLMSILEKNEKKMSELMYEREKERELVKKMYKFLEKKNLLEELDKEYPSSSEEEDGHKKKSLKEKKVKSKYESSDEEEEERSKEKTLKEKKSRSKYASSEEEEEKNKRISVKDKRTRIKYESADKEERGNRMRPSKGRKNKSKYALQKKRKRDHLGDTLKRERVGTSMGLMKMSILLLDPGLGQKSLK